MAQKETRPQSTSVSIPADLILSPDTVRRISESIEGPMPAAHKIVQVAIGSLEALAAGAILMPYLTVKRVIEAVGRDVDATDIADLAEAGAGRKNGKLAVTLEVDPAYEPMLQQVADFQGVTLAEVLQNAMYTAWDNGWLYSDVSNEIQRLAMTSQDKAALEKVLGRPFHSGTELLKLLRETLGEDLFGDAEVPAAAPAPAVISRSRSAEEWEALSKEEKVTLMKESAA